MAAAFDPEEIHGLRQLFGAAYAAGWKDAKGWPDEAPISDEEIGEIFSAGDRLFDEWVGEYMAQLAKIAEVGA